MPGKIKAAAQNMTIKAERNPDSLLIMSSHEPPHLLLKIHDDGTVEGELENMSEAASVFVGEVRRILSESR